MALMESTDTPRPKVTGRTRDLVIALDRGIFSLAKHWLLYFNLFIFAYVGLPFLAPVLMNTGLTAPARVIYSVYGGFCHQLGYRSWYLFGERPVYPRDIFQQYSGIDPDNPATGFWDSRAFVGNERMGYKVAFCQRDVAIYGAILLFGLVYALPFVRARLKPLHWVAWGLIGIAPVALDGFSQLFSQYPYNAIPFLSLFPYRESTPLLRTLTGGLFGLCNAWLAYPYVEESMREMRVDLEVKLKQVGGSHQSPVTSRQ